MKEQEDVEAEEQVAPAVKPLQNSEPPSHQRGGAFPKHRPRGVPRVAVGWPWAQRCLGSPCSECPRLEQAGG